MTFPEDPLIVANPMTFISYRIWHRIVCICPSDRFQYLTVIPNIIMATLQLFYIIFAGDILDRLVVYGFLNAIHIDCIVSRRKNSPLFHSLD